MNGREQKDFFVAMEEDFWFNLFRKRFMTSKSCEGNVYDWNRFGIYFKEKIKVQKSSEDENDRKKWNFLTGYGPRLNFKVAYKDKVLIF